MTVISRRFAVGCTFLGLLALPAALTVGAVQSRPVLGCTTLFIRHDVADEKYRSLAKEARFASVASIRSADKVIGSGVLVHERWILTDAHIFKSVDLASVTIELGNAKYRATKKVVHPEYERTRLVYDESAVVRKGVDLALVRLKQRVKHQEPVRRAARPVKIGTTVFLCGFGAWGTAEDLQTKTRAGVKRAGTNVIDAIGIGEGKMRVPKLYYVFDMDSVAGDRNVTGDAKPTALEAVGTGGDSGGGVFADVDGVWRLVGIFATARYDTSREVLQAYGTLNFITRIDKVGDWIDKTLRGDVAEGG